MNDKPKSIWTRPLLPNFWPLNVIGWLLGLPWRFIRGLFSFRMLKRYAFALACLATLIALFYAEENWRGKHAWNNFKREQEAKGENLDWHAFVPPPVPDDQNFAMTPFWEEERTVYWGPNGRMSYMDYDKVAARFKQFHLSAYRSGPGQPDDPPPSSWDTGIRADMRAWQAYYRAPTKTFKGQPLPGALTNEFPIPATPGDPAKDVLMALGKFDEAVNMLREGSRRPYTRFPLNWNDNFGMLLPHLARMKACSQYFRMRVSAELAAGQLQAAQQDQHLAFYLSDCFKSEPIEISQLVRAAMMEISFGGLWDGMIDHQWTPAQLDAFQKHLESEDFLADFQRSLKAEVAFVEPGMDDFARLRLGAFTRLFEGSQVASPGLKLYLRYAPSGWFRQETIPYIRLVLKSAELIDSKSQRVALDRVPSLEPTYGEYEHHAVLMRYLNDIFPSLSEESNPHSAIDNFQAVKMANRSVRAQTSVNLGILACALERYWFDNHAYPETLESLAPKYVAKIPVEIVSGQPLKYRRSEDGRFVLYSTGLKGNDSGGIFRTADKKLTGNWVWRYPAK